MHVRACACVSVKRLTPLIYMYIYIYVYIYMNSVITALIIISRAHSTVRRDPRGHITDDKCQEENAGKFRVHFNLVMCAEVYTVRINGCA